MSHLAIISNELLPLTCYMLRWDVILVLIYLCLSLSGINYIFIEIFSFHMRAIVRGALVLGLGPCQN